MTARLANRFFPALLVASALSGAAWAQSAPFDEIEVRAACEAKWPDDFAMQSYCIRQHTEGHADYSERYADESDDGMIVAFQKCEQEWMPQWSMVAYCADQQLRGRRQLGEMLKLVPADVAESITAKCVRDWPDDFAMTDYCAERQAGAWQELNQ